MKWKLCKAVAFIAIGVVLFSGFWKVFRFKYAKGLEQYYRLPKNTVDVLFIGSSHAFRSLDPSVMYGKSGISSYALGSNAQPMWITYYYLKEALRTQKPKVVCLEAYKVYLQKDYSDAPTVIKGTISMRTPWNYLASLWVSIEDKHEYLDCALGFPWFHTRYRELSVRQDFAPHYGKPYYEDFLGFFGEKPKAVELPSGVEQVTKEQKISDKTRLYLDKIVRLSQEQDFELLFLIAPYYTDAVERQPYYNSLQNYADANGIPMINGNLLYDTLGLDEKTDFGRGNHLSMSGAVKFSRYVSRYLSSHYELADHRGNKKYGRWERNHELMDKYRESAQVETSSED